MKLNNFKLLTDENIHPEVVTFLRQKGFEVEDVQESRLNGSTDIFLLNRAFQSNSIIITHDSDFGKIIFTQVIDFVGIIYLRPGHFQSSFTISTLQTILQEDFEIEIPFIMVAENNGENVKIRLRNL